MSQLELKLEYMLIIELLEMLSEDDGTIRYEGDVIECTLYLARAMQDEGLPAGVPWDRPFSLAVECERVLLGSGCKHNVSGIRSALQVYRRGDTGVWWNS